MKIIAIGYYDDFARFFLSIKKCLNKEKSNLEFKYLSLYLSGWLYFIVRFQRVSFFSLKVWVNALIRRKKYNKLLKNKVYKEIDLDNIIKYHLYLEPKLEFKLKKQALSYIDVIENYLNNHKPDALILSGDSRMSIEIFDFFAKKLKIETFHFEQGPFGTTILDRKGVNANASIRDKTDFKTELELSETKKEIEIFFNRKKSVKYKRNPLYRGSDYLLEKGFKYLNIIPPDTLIGKVVKVGASEYKELGNKWHKDKKVYLLILQVPHDVNMVYHSPFYKNHYSIVKDVYNSLPFNSQLIVREHPLFKKKYESELYEFMSKEHITLDCNGLYESIDKCNVVIVNNSTVGIEAVLKLKPVVVLGNSYYDNDLICLKLKTKENLKELLKGALTHSVNENHILAFLDFFTKNFLINGHFRDKEITSSKVIVDELINLNMSN